MPSKNGRENSESAGLLKNKHTGDSSSRRTSLPSKDTMLTTPKPIKRESINSPFILMINLSQDISCKCQSVMKNKLPQMMKLIQQSELLIGPPKEELLELKIKDNVVHVGLFQLLVLYNLGVLLQKKELGIFLNNN